MGSFFGNKFPALLGFNDSIKAMFGAVSTFALLVIVCVISALERPLFGQVQLTPMGLDYFIKGGAVIIAWLFLRASSDEIHKLIVLLARAIRPGPVDDDEDFDDTDFDDVDFDDVDFLDARDFVPRRFRRVMANLWIPVTLQFWLVGWLIYASGGLKNSPYSMVLPAMLIIGQSVYPTSPIRLGADPRPRDFLVFVWRMACYYGYPQLMFGSLLVALVLLQEYHPLVTKPGPAAETIFVTQVSIFVVMCVVFVTKRLDRAAAPGTHG